MPVPAPETTTSTGRPEVSRWLTAAAWSTSRVRLDDGRLVGGLAHHPGGDGGGGVVEHGRLQLQLGGGGPAVVAAVQPRRPSVGPQGLGRQLGIGGRGQAHRPAIGQDLGRQVLDDVAMGVDPGRHLPDHVAGGEGGVVCHQLAQHLLGQLSRADGRGVAGWPSTSSRSRSADQPSSAASWRQRPRRVSGPTLWSLAGRLVRVARW